MLLVDILSCVSKRNDNIKGCSVVLPFGPLLSQLFIHEVKIKTKLNHNKSPDRGKNCVLLYTKAARTLDFWDSQFLLLRVQYEWVVMKKNNKTCENQ